MDLEKSFGRGGFKALNDKLQIFDISTNWSKVEKLTRSYKLTEQTQKVMEDHLAKVDDKLISLLTLDGKEMHTLPKAIASKDKNNVTAIAWKGAKPLNMIRVDVDKMREVLAYMENMLIRKRGHLSANNWDA